MASARSMAMAQIPPGAMAAALASSWLLTACGSAAPPPPPPQVEVQAVQRERFGQTLDTVSTLEASEEVELAAQAGGRVLRILVPSGTPVRRGQLVLVLDQTQLQADVAALQAQVVRDQLNYQRYQQLVSQGAASALQRDEYRASYIASREALRARQADLAFKDVRAPIDGVMGDWAVKPGDVIAAGTSFSRIIRNDRLQIRVDVPANQAQAVQVGQPVQLLDRSGGQPLAQGRITSLDPSVSPATQTLLAKADIANPSGRLRNGQRLRTRVLLGETEQLAVPFSAVSQNSGQAFVFLVGTLAQLRRDPGKAPLQTLAKLPASTRVVLQRPVRLGPLQGNRYPVLSGLQAGAPLITSSTLGLRHGQPVTPVAARRDAEPAPPAPGAS